MPFLPEAEPFCGRAGKTVSETAHLANLFVTWYVCVYRMCYRKTDLDLEKLQLFRKAWDTKQLTNREHYFNVTSALLTNS